MKVFDSHTHISINEESYYNGNFKIEQLIRSMDNARIEKSIVMLNPLIKIAQCHNGFRTICDCKDNKDFMEIRCSECGNLLYIGEDPLRDLNIKLLELCSRYKDRLDPMLYFYLSNNTINNEVKFFQENYDGLYKGYKLNAAQSNCSINDIFFDSNLPLILHTGRKKYDVFESQKEFISRYNGNIILAHACRLKPEAIEFIKNNNNIYIDISPLTLMYERRTTDLYGPFNAEETSMEDILEFLINNLSDDKILFGTDTPFTSQKKEVESFVNLSISNESKKKILSLNYNNIFKEGEIL